MNMKRLTFDLEARLERDVEDMRAHVGAGGDEVQRVALVLVPHQRVARHRQLRAQRRHAVREHLQVIQSIYTNIIRR